LINKNLVYGKVLVDNSTNTTVDVLGSLLEDTAQTFISSGISIGDIVSTVTGGITYNVTVLSIASETQLTVSLPTGVVLFDVISKPYYIYSSTELKEAEKVTHSKITMLNNSLLTKPNLTYPAYTQNGNLAEIHPSTVNGIGQLVSQYIRFPYIPKWTYVELVSGEPSFNASDADYQDFELPNDDEVNLINKILQYAGMSIREIEVVNFAKASEQSSEQEEK